MSRGNRNDDRLDLDDEALLAELRSVVERVDPAPPHVVAAARAAAGWRRIDSELAALTYDSYLDERFAGVRSGHALRQLSFATPDLTIELEVAADPGRLSGQLVPPQPADIEVRHRNGSVAAEADALGHFSIDRLPSGPVSIRCARRSAGRREVTATDWVVI